VELPASLDDALDVALGHRLADVPVDDSAAASVEEGAQVVEAAGDVDVGDIDVPVLVGLQPLVGPSPCPRRAASSGR
jgi:hypothetical protein